jgi:hypothetical protein
MSIIKSLQDSVKGRRVTVQTLGSKGMTVLLHVLGLSYGVVEDFTTALGCGVEKTTVGGAV